MYDLIGDIHGHADRLIELLELLGYEPVGGSYRHPERRVIFLGDFIDRGPKILETLKLVRVMVEAGHALAVMGNHELNALAYHTPDPHSPGEFVRPHSSKNNRQHHATVAQLTPAELDSFLAWFRTLPLVLERDGLRVVHACWDSEQLAVVAAGIAEHGGVTTGFLRDAYGKGTPLFSAIEVVLKGREGKLPEGFEFSDKDGHRRRTFRTRWYLPADGHTYRTYAFQADEVPCDLPLEASIKNEARPYPNTAEPVFIGHYWLRGVRPEILTANVACLDYSVAKQGFLCAYRWNGERQLTNDHFVWTG